MKKEAYKKSLTIILPFIAIIALLAWFVFAAAGDNIIIESPLKGQNFSGALTVLLNASFDNATDAGNTQHVVNATFYISLNSAGTSWLLLGGGGGTTGTNSSNSSHCLVSVDAAINSSCFDATFNISRLINGTNAMDGIHLINVTLLNNTGGQTGFRNLTLLVNLGNITIDNTQPRTAAFQSMTSGNNHSTRTLGGNFTLNASADDALANVSIVQFMIFNESAYGNGNFTVTAGTKEGTTTFYSTNINTSHYLDGTYNITLFVNDTAGNHNLTANGTTYVAAAILRKMIIDNTAPTVSHSCTPNPVEQGATLTCTCSGTDWPAGANSTVFTANPSTQLSGPSQTTTCTVTDRAGNEKSSVFTYTVTGTGGGGGGGSTGGAGGGATGGGSTGGSTGPNGTGSSTGSQGGSTGSGGSGQGTQPGAGGAGGLSTGIIIAIIIAAIVVVVIIVMLKKKSATTIAK